MAGNVVEDRTAAGCWTPGGPALYTACQARALGAAVFLVTRLTPDYDRSVLEGIELSALPARQAPRYANTYDANGVRSQLLLHPGEPLDTLPRTSGRFDAAILAPAFHELDDLARDAAAEPLDADIVAVALQGLLRAVDAEDRVIPEPRPWPVLDRLLRSGDLAFLSDEDTADAAGMARELARRGLIVALTHGDHGATVYHGASTRELAALPAEPVDPTGAGDAFATAFTVRYAETGDIEEAAVFALAAGAVATEGSGPDAMPDRDAVTARMRAAT